MPEMIKDIKIRGEPNIGTILDEYTDGVATVPTEEAKQFFKEWEGKVPVKLIRQSIFAGIYWAYTHPRDVEVHYIEKEVGE